MAKPVKVTIKDSAAAVPSQTPSEQLIAEAAKEVSHTAPSGHRYQLTKPDLLSEFRLTAMVGGERAENMPYMMMIAPIIYISAINGEAVGFPQTFRELEARIKRVGADYPFLAQAVADAFGEKENPEAVKTAIKK